jgi:hypothetical protein
VVIKKSARGANLPGVHPGLMDRIREAEDAELRGQMPRKLEGPQKITRPSVDVSTQQRHQQVKLTGLVEGAGTVGTDIRIALAKIPAFMPGVDLDTVWDTLSETQKIRAGGVERFRMELDVTLEEAAAPFISPHQLSGRLDARNLNRCRDNLLAETDESFKGVLAPDSAHLLDGFIRSTSELISRCLKQNQIAGIKVKPLYDILRDWVRKLVYQELLNRVRSMGDRGIRRIVANVELTDQIYSQLKRQPSFSPRQALLSRLICVHQDLGHTCYAARTSYRGTKMHRSYGARLFSDELNRYRALFTHDELECARYAVASHSESEFPFATNRVLALARAVDHLAPFAPYRVYMHLAKLPGARPYLDDLISYAQQGRLEDYVARKKELEGFLYEVSLPVSLCEDIMAAFRPFDKGLVVTDMGQWGADIVDLTYDAFERPGSLAVQLEAQPFAKAYQCLFDYQQSQFLNLARSHGFQNQSLQTVTEITCQKDEAGTLSLKLNMG